MVKQCRGPCGETKPDYEFLVCYICGRSDYCSHCIIENGGRCFNDGTVLIDAKGKPVTPPKPSTPVAIPRPPAKRVTLPVTTRFPSLSGYVGGAIGFIVFAFLAVILSFLGFNSLQQSMVSWTLLLGQIGSIYSAVKFSVLDYLAHPYTLAVSMLPTNSSIPIIVLALLGFCVGLLLIRADMSANVSLFLGVIIQVSYLLNYPPFPTDFIYGMGSLIIQCWFNLSIGAQLPITYEFLQLVTYLLAQFTISYLPLLEYSYLDFFLTIGLLWITGFAGGFISSKLRNEIILTLWGFASNIFTIASILWAFVMFLGYTRLMGGMGFLFLLFSSIILVSLIMAAIKSEEI